MQRIIRITDYQDGRHPQDILISVDSDAKTVQLKDLAVWNREHEKWENGDELREYTVGILKEVEDLLLCK